MIKEADGSFLSGSHINLYALLKPLSADNQPGYLSNIYFLSRFAAPSYDKTNSLLNNSLLNIKPLDELL